MSEKNKHLNKDQNSNDSLLDKSKEGVSFDSRDLDQAVIDRLSRDADKEAQMIANFNAKVNLPASNEPKQDGKAGVNDNEEGGPSGPEPTRYGDWEKKGRCFDF